MWRLWNASDFNCAEGDESGVWTRWRSDVAGVAGYTDTSLSVVREQEQLQGRCGAVCGEAVVPGADVAEHCAAVHHDLRMRCILANELDYVKKTFLSLYSNELCLPDDHGE